MYWFVIAKNLLPQSYGIISTSVNLMLLLGSISMFGLNTAIAKLIPEYSKKKQEEKIISLIRFSTKIVSISNLILISIILINIFESPESKIGLISALIGGFLLDTWSSQIFGFWTGLCLLTVVLIKFIIKKYVKVPEIKKIIS